MLEGETSPGAWKVGGKGVTASQGGKTGSERSASKASLLPTPCPRKAGGASFHAKLHAPGNLLQRLPGGPRGGGRVPLEETSSTVRGVLAR